MIAQKLIHPQLAQALQPGFGDGAGNPQINRRLAQQRILGAQRGGHNAGVVGVDQHPHRPPAQAVAIVLAAGLQHRLIRRRPAENRVFVVALQAGDIYIGSGIGPLQIEVFAEHLNTVIQSRQAVKH